ncbi:MAG: hypothetical protein J6P03_04405, partial [Opitutales bacterium]|nr:hypothetical protein [Opitutales bacterium]
DGNVEYVKIHSIAVFFLLLVLHPKSMRLNQRTLGVLFFLFLIRLFFIRIFSEEAIKRSLMRLLTRGAGLRAEATQKRKRSFRRRGRSLRRGSRASPCFEAEILNAEAGARNKKAWNRIYIHSKLFLTKQRTSAPKALLKIN